MFHSWNKNLLVFYTLQYKEIIFIHIHCTISDYIIVEILCRIHIPRGLKVGWSHTLAREVRKSHIALPSVGQKHLYTGNALLQQAFSSLPLRHAAGYAMWNRWVEVNIEWYSTLKLTIPQRYNSGERDSWKELLYVCNAKKTCREQIQRFEWTHFILHCCALRPFCIVSRTILVRFRFNKNKHHPSSLGLAHFSLKSEYRYR